MEDRRPMFPARVVQPLAVGLWLAAAACGHGPVPAARPAGEHRSTAPHSGPGEQPHDPDVEDEEPAVAPHAALASEGEVALFRAGRQVALLTRREARQAGYFLLDVGRDWVPELFRSSPGLPNNYEARFVELANGRFPDTPEGRRARQDRYLELYGIPPTPALLSERFSALAIQPCAGLAAGPALSAFQGSEWDEQDELPAEPVARPVTLAIQERLRCAGHLRAATDQLDARTRRALEEFERRHRIYARGSLAGETLEALKRSPLELERRALLRALTERLVLDLGVIEDGSAASVGDSRRGAPTTPVVDQVERLESHLRSALGLGDVEGLRSLYQRLAGALDRPDYTLALDPIELPGYHRAHMDLFAEIDRGDIYYDFPFDADGRPRPQPVEHRPTVTLMARVGESILPLARFGTTIGGWRIQRHRGQDVFAYKESPVGPRAWTRIVAAPVWLPPANTPPASLVLQTRKTNSGELIREVNENLVGPGYASAYGLVAAYHRKVELVSGSEPRVGNDEGIRTHGSSDYTSVWRRASLGCHRLHNHRAVRLFNFILLHRNHRRTGHQPIRFRMPVVLDDFETVIDLQRSGYGIELTPPLPVNVLPGRVLGTARRKSERQIPTGEVLGPPGAS